jgi:hypothetical protein
MCLTRPTHAFHQLPELNIDTVKCTAESLSVYIDTLLTTLVGGNLGIHRAHSNALHA